MTTQFSDFLAANAARIADLWFRQIQSISTEPVPPADSARGPRQFINEVVVGLSADDLRPLIAFYQLDPAMLLRWRTAMAKDPKRFQSMLRALERNRLADQLHQINRL